MKVSKNEVLPALALWILCSVPVLQACPSILLATNEELMQGQSVTDGAAEVLLVQQPDGNLQIYSERFSCLVWESGFSEPVSGGAFYSTRLQGDGNLVTTRDELGGENQTTHPWSAGLSVGESSDYYLLLRCDWSVGIYDASLSDIPLWEQQGHRRVVMAEGETVRSDEPPLERSGLYIQQMSNGEVVIREGSLSEPGPVLWRSCARGDELGVYATTLQQDSQFVTRSEIPSSSVLWTRDSFAVDWDHPWELAIICDNLVITDPRDSTIVWQTELRSVCEVPTCDSALILLETNEAINSSLPKNVGDSYALEQSPFGSLRLLKAGTTAPFECVLWESSDAVMEEMPFEIFTRMQRDGNLVTYARNFNETDTYAVWDTKSALPDVNMTGTFTLVIDKCQAVNETVIAIYNGNPTLPGNAEVIWYEPFEDSC